MLKYVLVACFALTMSLPTLAAGPRRQCIRAGGIWVINSNGFKFCMHKRAQANDESRAGLFARRKCLRDGGIWMISSHGKFCMKKLEPIYSTLHDDDDVNDEFIR